MPVDPARASALANAQMDESDLFEDRSAEIEYRDIAQGFWRRKNTLLLFRECL